jgi:type II secretion system protein I
MVRIVGDRRGFTLLEVLVALAVLGVAITAVLQVSSGSLRLLRLAGEHQDAVLLADRVARASMPTEPGVETGSEGAFTWERRVTVIAVAPELTQPGVPDPQLFSVAVTVRWGRGQSLELATIRTGPPASQS